MRQLYTLFFLLLSAGLFSQTNTPLVLSSGGNYVVNGSYSQSVTIGELAVETLNSSGYYLMQGFQQPLSTPELEASDGDKRICLNDSVSFSVFASGGGILNFQWRRKGVDIPGENDSIIIFNPVTYADSGLYDCVINNTIGTIYSDEMRLAVDTLPVVTFNLADQICINDSPLLMDGGLPLGGTYSINEVPFAIFDPSTAGLLTHEVYYDFVDGNGCSGSASQLLTVNDITTAGLTLADEICINSDPLELNGGTPQGGIYEGNGVFEASFNPMITGLGSFDLAYVYTNANGCSDTAWHGIVVNDTTVVQFGVMEGVCFGYPSFQLSSGIPAGGLYSGLGVTDDNFFSESAGVGVHDLRYTYTNNHGCITFNDQTIEVYAPPEISIGDDIIICSQTTVTLDAGIGYINYEWSTGADTQTVQVSDEDNYWVRVTDDNNCVSSDDMEITHSTPNNDLEICVVTVSNDGKNLIVWEPINDPGIAYYNILKQKSTANEFEMIGSIPYGSETVFIDEDSNPQSHSDFYKVSVTDSCGVESDRSSYHKTIHLQVSKDEQSGGNNLEWDHVEIEGADGAYPTYYIYRGESYANLEEYESIASNVNQWTDTNPPDNRAYYFVAAKKLSACLPSTKKKSLMAEDYSMSISNIDEAAVDGIGRDFLSGMRIYPNPTRDFAIVEFDNEDNKPYTFVLMDASGRVIQLKEDVISDRVEVARDNLEDGVYMITLIGDKIFRGQIVFSSAMIHNK